MNRKHEQPNDRPIHPACKKLMSADFKCTCTIEWRGWDGSPDALDRRIELTSKKELRTGWGAAGSMGYGPDADEALQENPAHRKRQQDEAYVGQQEVRAGLVVEHDGFWKESENLKTIRGDAHWEDDVDRGLLMDKLRVQIAESGLWGDCEGAELDEIRSRIEAKSRT